MELFIFLILSVRMLQPFSIESILLSYCYRGFCFDQNHWELSPFLTRSRCPLLSPYLSHSWMLLLLYSLVSLKFDAAITFLSCHRSFGTCPLRLDLSSFLLQSLHMNRFVSLMVTDTLTNLLSSGTTRGAWIVLSACYSSRHRLILGFLLLSKTMNRSCHLLLFYILNRSCYLLRS